MRAMRIERGQLPPAGAVLAQNVPKPEGGVALDKGRVLGAEELQRLSELSWTELHVLALEPGDVHEEAAGKRLAAALAGDGVDVEPQSAGAFPLVARHRGLLDYDPALLAHLNEIEDLAVYARPPASIASEGERIGGAKIVPFVTREERLSAAERIASGGLLRVRRFLPVRVAALVEDSVEERVLSRARRALEEKLAFFGSKLATVERVPLVSEALVNGLRGALRSGAELRWTRWTLRWSRWSGRARPWRSMGSRRSPGRSCGSPTRGRCRSWARRRAACSPRPPRSISCCRRCSPESACRGRRSPPSESAD